MALLGDFGDDYTRTGKGAFTTASNFTSYLPTAIKNFPILGTPITAIFGYIDTFIETGRWLFKGQFGSAATAAAAGFVGTSVNAIGNTFWWNAGSGLLTGQTLGTHARKLTEEVIGGVTGALGAKPTVLRSYTAGLGSGPGGMLTGAPGQFATNEANRRGQNANQMYQNYMRSENGVNVAARGGEASVA